MAQLQNSSGRANMAQFVRGIIPVISLAEEPPEIEPVFVPEAGARWGKPSDLQFRIAGTAGDVEEPPPTSGVVVDRNEYIKRHGSEVTSQVTDPQTGAVVIEPYTYVCYIGTFERKREEREPLPGGIAVKVKKITEIVDLYVDARNFVSPLPPDQLISGKFVRDNFVIVEG